MVSFQIAIPSCENPFSSDGSTPEIIGDVYEPNNNYYADVRIIKVGVFGCTQALVFLDGEPLSDVEIKINKIQLEEEDYGVFGDPEGKTHAWLTAFAPFDKPDIVATALIEKGGEGSYAAAPVVEEIMNYYFHER